MNYKNQLTVLKEKTSKNKLVLACMKKFSIVAGILVFVSALVIIVSCTIYKINIGKVSNNSELKEFEVTTGQTFSTIGDELKQQNLIKSEFFYKLYIKLYQVEGLEAGKYLLSEDMGVKKIVDTLKEGSTYNPDTITITFREGMQMRQIAEVIAENTNHEEEEVLSLAKDETYIRSLMEKYSFLPEDILDTSIYYPLEGYLFPDTYQFINADVSIQDIFETMLKQMDKKLKMVEKDIKNSDYSIHEIMTLASMIQSEGNNSSDFAKMASVFLTRLDKGMKLQSCASAYYGDHKIMGRDDFGTSYSKKNPYNTYVVNAIPAGPISNPGIEAIKAVLHPSDSEYLYFASDKNMKVYFSKTLAEHESTIAQLKKAGNWYGS